jgi:Ulp1 family protease
LLDTNTHDFESIECLKWLNDFFRKELNIAATIRRVAFVQPKKYRNPEIINASVAYFEKVKDAREWLKRVHI